MNQAEVQPITQRNASPSGNGETTAFPNSRQQQQKVRKKSWFKLGSKNGKNNPIRQLLKKSRQVKGKKKKIDYRDVRQKYWLSRKLKKTALGRQPATPHNTTQFIVNTGHFPTDPYAYDFDNQRFPEDKFNHSMLGSMRNMMLNNSLQSKKPKEDNQSAKDTCINSDSLEKSKEESKSDNNFSEVKGFKNYFPENVYDLMKGRSESDINSICDYHPDRRISNLAQTPNMQSGQIDIKILIEGVKNGQHNLENIIKSLVNQIKEKDDIITNLKAQKFLAKFSS